MKKAILKIAPALAISAILSAVMLGAYRIDLFEGVERSLFDLRLKIRGQLPHGDNVVVAVISDQSVRTDELGRWPWPRAYQAFLVEALNEYGAKVVGYDVFFPEPDENIPFSGVRNMLRTRFETYGLNKPASGAELAENLKTFYEIELGAAFDNAEAGQVDMVKEAINPDGLFSQTLAKYDDVILGYYFNTSESPKKKKEILDHGYEGLALEFKSAGLKMPAQVQDDYKAVVELLDALQSDMDNHVPYEERLEAVKAVVTRIEASKKNALGKNAQPDSVLQSLISKFYFLIESDVLYSSIVQLERETDSRSEEITAEMEKNAEFTKISAVPFTEEEEDINPFIRAYTFPPPIETFANNTKHFGHVTVIPDPDGVIRYNMALVNYGGRLYPSLSLLASSMFLGESLDVDLQPDGEPPSLILGNKNVPLDEDGRLLINYRGQKRYPEINIYHIIRKFVNQTPHPDSYAPFFKEVLKKTPEEYYTEVYGKEPGEGDIESMIFEEFIENDTIAKRMVDWESERGFKETYGMSPQQAFKDKIVLVGATAVGVYDLRVTPFSENYPGVMIHAQVIDSILRGDFLQRPEFGETYALIIIAALAIILGLLIPTTSALRGALLVLLLTGLLFVVDYYYFFVGKGYWMPLSYPAIQMGVVFFAVTIYRYATEEKEKRFIKDTFGRYLAPSVVKQITENPDMVKLGGEKLEMTAFFSDIQGFSSISEKLGDPQLLVELLNDYLSVMAHTIEEFEGTIDKYEGDAIIAFWGAPVHFPDHAVKACYACLEQQVKLGELREKWRNEGRWPEMVNNARVRMGLNTGDMVVGNMGSEGRMNYTIMGDAVNLASRLEGANKPYGTYIMISEFTYKAVQNFVEVRELDSLRVMGKSEPVRVYELLAKKGQVNPQKRRVVEVYNEGLAAYKTKDWETGIARFTEALEIDPTDGPSKTYLARCEDFASEAPPEDWDGVFVMKEK